MGGGRASDWAPGEILLGRLIRYVFSSFSIGLEEGRGGSLDVGCRTGSSDVSPCGEIQSLNSGAGLQLDKNFCSTRNVFLQL